MSKRLQVVVHEAELRRFRRAARRAGTTLSEWVRQTLRRAERELSPADADQKLDRLREIAARAERLNIPSPDIEQMEAEIEDAYTEAIDRSLGRRLS